MSAIDKEPFPRGALIAAAALIGFSLLAAGYGRFSSQTDATESAIVQTAPARSMALTFIDEADGAVSVRDVVTGAVVITLAPGGDAFIRSVLRTMARDRRARGIDRAPPFRLSQWTNGTLVLEDTATGRRVDLRAFGQTNKQAFARILDAQSPLTQNERTGGSGG
ncbi:MAG: photosynthetic complex assembly protein PuhC [Hyphomonadaceae bacterium]|nr:photosynthetic complex assembly protein PuhC [Hyphomonadaceae bacterium]